MSLTNLGLADFTYVFVLPSLSSAYMSDKLCITEMRFQINLRTEKEKGILTS